MVAVIYALVLCTALSNGATDCRVMTVEPSWDKATCEEFVRQANMGLSAGMRYYCASRQTWSIDR